jgi:hypothetical protein
MMGVDLITKKETIARNQLSSVDAAVANVAVIYSDAKGAITTL